MRKLTILLFLIPVATAAVAADAPAVERQDQKVAAVADATTPAAPNYNLDWYSINSGGDIEVASTNYRLGLSVGQAAAGAAAGTNYNLGLGFWYIFGGAQAACPVAMTGDVNTSGEITSSDIIYCVNFVFKGGPAPQPCEAAGDVNCNGTVTSSDIIYLVNHVFKGGPVPCDVCTIIPAMWTCP